MKPVYLIWGLAVIPAFFNCGTPEPKVYPNRWFYLVRSLENDNQVTEVCSLVQVAKQETALQFGLCKWKSDNRLL